MGNRISIYLIAICLALAILTVQSHAVDITGQMTIEVSTTTSTTSTSTSTTTSTSTSTSTISTTTSTSVSTTTIPTIQAGAITPASPTIDNGQSITLYSAPSEGTPPYEINWYAQASCGGAIQSTGPSYSPSPISTTTYSYEVTDADLNSACSPSDIVTVNPILGTPSISPLNPLVFKDWGYVISSDWSGGSPGYTAKLYSSPTSCSSSSTLEQSKSTYSNSISFLPVFPQVNTYYCIYVTDSALDPQIKNSINSFFVLNPQTLPVHGVLPLHWHGYPFST